MTPFFDIESDQASFGKALQLSLIQTDRRTPKAHHDSEVDEEESSCRCNFENGFRSTWGKPSLEKWSMKVHARVVGTDFVEVKLSVGPSLRGLV